MDEQDLVTLCQSSDKRALRILYDKYARLMMGVAMRYVVDRESSKDILHDCFVKIFESIKGFEYRGVGSLNAWIRRIVVNTALDFLKKKSSLNVTGDIDTIVEIPTEEDNIEIYAEVSDDVIIECIGRLPDKLRVVFNLFIFEDMPHSEIARMLGITESVSRVRVHRAKTLLAQTIRLHINENR